MKTGEPAVKPPPGYALIASVVCRHCKGQSFKVMLDVSHRKLKIGDTLKSSDQRDRIKGIECTACGEQYTIATPFSFG